MFHMERCIWRVGSPGFQRCLVLPDVSEEHVACSISGEDQDKQKTKRKGGKLSWGDMFLQNVGLSQNYTTSLQVQHDESFINACASQFADTVKSNGGKLISIFGQPSKKTQYSWFCASSNIPKSFGSYICFRPQVIQWLSLALWNGYNSVGIATRLGLDSRGSISSRGKSLFSSPWSSDLLWGPLCIPEDKASVTWSWPLTI
jgi:hypothetical protein